MRHKRAIAAAMCAALIPSALLASGCKKKSDNVVTTITTQTTKNIAIGARNQLFHGALTVTITGYQRRPLSVFTEVGAAETATSASKESIQNDDVIEVDFQIEYNKQTFAQYSDTDITTLGDILPYGTMLRVQGKDGNGGDYACQNVLYKATDDDKTVLPTSNRWSYAMLEDPLPDAGTVMQGSILFEVSSAAQDLEMIMISPTGNADPTDPDAVMEDSYDVWKLDLN